jgi:hypothetical protein
VPHARHWPIACDDSAPADRDAILIGGSHDEWTPLVNVEALETLDVEQGVHAGWSFRGVKPRAGD